MKVIRSRGGLVRQALLGAVEDVGPAPAPVARSTLQAAFEAQQASHWAARWAADWARLAAGLAAVLRIAQPGQRWTAQLDALQAHARGLAGPRPDAALYQLIHHASHSVQRYSSHHAWLCWLACEQAAPLLGWTGRRTEALSRAALLMNVAMAGLQDRLAQATEPPDAEQRRLIDAHAAAGAEQLLAAGLDDPLCIEVVRHHHEPERADVALESLDEACQLARLLRRVDIFGAKISRRGARPPMSPVQAARQACLGRDGQPDPLGAALLKALGLYPPGSYVRLASGEVAVVVARGPRPSQPQVASVLSAAGVPVLAPELIDTRILRHAVQQSVPAGAVQHELPHVAILGLR